MLSVTFLGTGAACPTVDRNVTSLAVQREGEMFLFDCGEGTQRQILQSGLGFKRLNRILITHGHLDHILGLAGLLSTFMRWETIEELEIYAGHWALERIHDLLYGVVLRGAHPPMEIRLLDVKPGVFLEGGDFSVSAVPVYHRGPDCYGYLFEEKARRPFLPERAEALQLPPGPWRRDLVDGQPITLPDGRVITPDQVLGPEKPGTRLLVIGDVGRTDDLVDACRGVDALVIEATYLDEEAELAREFAHITARQASELAIQAGVNNLILTHISRRYREREVLDEAQGIYPGVRVARDFDIYQVRREQFLKVENRE